MVNRTAASAVVAFTRTGALVLQCHGAVPIDREALGSILSRRDGDDRFAFGLFAATFDVIRDEVKAVHLPHPLGVFPIVSVSIENVTLRKLRAEAAREMGLVD